MVRGTLLVETENGQYQLVNVGSAQGSEAIGGVQDPNGLSNPAGTQPTPMSSQPLPLLANQQHLEMPQQSPPVVHTALQSSPGVVDSLPHTTTEHSVPAPVPHHVRDNLVATVQSAAQPMQQQQQHQVVSSAGDTMPNATAVPTSTSTTPNVQTSTAPQGNLVTTVQSAAQHKQQQHQAVNSAGGMMTNAAAVPTSATTTPSVQTSTRPQTSTDTDKIKCKTFLSTLLRLTSNQPDKVVTNVKNLVQGLIDGTVAPEDFTNQIQRMLNSSPKPHLTPFLKKSLPHLRLSLITKELSIEGVRPPAAVEMLPLATTQAQSQPTSVAPQVQLTQRANLGQQNGHGPSQPPMVGFMQSHAPDFINTRPTISEPTPPQMSVDTAKKKCRNFLSTLLRLASDQPDQVATNVKNLIQGLIDGAVTPEDFTNQLQKELNSSPQPCLIPFFKKSLPALRRSLTTNELSIEGVRPPAAVEMSPLATTQAQPQPTSVSPLVQLTQQHSHGPLQPPMVRFMQTHAPGFINTWPTVSELSAATPAHRVVGISHPLPQPLISDVAPPTSGAQGDVPPITRAPSTMAFSQTITHDHRARGAAATSSSASTTTTYTTVPSILSTGVASVITTAPTTVVLTSAAAKEKVHHYR